jgi:hypothetical protein
MRLFRLAFICLGISSSLLFAGVSNISVPSQKIHWANSLGDNYSPYDKKGYYHKAVIEINVPISLQGEYYLGFTLTNNEISRFAKHTIQNDAISFFISAKTNTNQYVLDWPMISSIKNVIPFKLSGNNLPVYRFPIYIWLNPGQNVAPGLYQKNLELNIYQGPFGETSNFTPVASGSVLFNVEVSNQVEVSIGTDNVDTFTDFNVRYEELKEGAQVNYDAFVHSISSYYLHVKSLNKGNLAHHLDEIDTRIPYTIYLDDQLVQFNEQGEFRVFVEKESGDIKSQHKLVMILGDASHAFKGDYSDRVSIKATTE